MILQLVHRPSLQMTAEVSGGALGLGQVMLQVVAALPLFGAGNLSLEGGNEGEVSRPYGRGAW